MSVIIGEDESGGALGVADRVLPLENAIDAVASPVACAAIVGRDAAKRRDAADQLAVTSELLLASGIVDEVLPELAGGAHRDADEAARLLDAVLRCCVQELRRQPDETLLARRHERFDRMRRTGRTGRLVDSRDDPGWRRH